MTDLSQQKLTENVQRRTLWPTNEPDLIQQRGTFRVGTEAQHTPMNRTFSAER